jgi:signal transduction histidine kinase
MMGEPLHILLFDEDPADLASVRHALDPSPKITLTCATTLAAALELAATNPFDALLLGLNLSAAGSLETISRLVQALPLMPIVIMTEDTDEDSLLAASRYGIQDYLLKGRADGPAILMASRSAIQRKQTEAASRQTHDELERRVQQRTAELERTNQALRMISACNGAVIRMTDEQTLMQEICRIVVEIGGYRMAWVGMAEDDGYKSVRPVASTGFDAGYLSSAHISWDDSERGAGPTGMAIRTGRMQVSQDFLSDPLLAPWRKEALGRGFRCSIALPLRQEEKVIGALTIYRSEPPPFEDGQIKILHELAEDLAFGLSALRMQADLRESRDRLRALASELTLTEQRERRRLAKVLHDHLQQLLVGAKFQAAVLGRRSDDEGVKKKAREIEELLDESIESSRSLTAELSPPILHEGGLAVGLEWLARWMADKHGLSVELPLKPEVSPTTEDVKVLVFESVRELLFNVVKHAQTKSATVTMQRQLDNRMRIEVTDNGVGFDPGVTKSAASGNGFGLFSIRERLDLIGGHLEVTSSPGNGSCFAITAPLGPAVSHEEEKEDLPTPPMTDFVL